MHLMQICLPVLMATIVYCQDQRKNPPRRNVTAQLLDPKRYDANIIPDFDEDYPTNVSVQITVHDMYSLSEANMEYSVDIYLRMWWIDERLNYTDIATYERLELDVKTMGSVWQPDLFFENEKRASFHTVTLPNKLMHLLRNGTVIYSVRLSLTLSCLMNLQFYPFDSQICPISVQSFGYTKDNINLDWKHPSPFQASTLEMPQFYFTPEDTELLDYTSPYSETGTFSTIKANLFLRRKVGFYFLQVFVPSILLVVLSWVSFWVDAGAVPARVSLGVTCVLTMTTQSSGTRQTLPPVSYVKAIDVWMFTCLLFVFAALLEFAYVNVLLRRKKKTKQEDIYENDENDKEKAKVELKKKNVFVALKNKYTTDDPKLKAAHVDKISRVVFPAAFCIFLVLFFCISILSSL